MIPYEEKFFHCNSSVTYAVSDGDETYKGTNEVFEKWTWAAKEENKTDKPSRKI